MALGTGIEIPNNFDLNAPLPLDARFSAADLTERDAIDSLVRYPGMQVHVESEATTFELKGGITNSDWSEIGGGGGGTSNISTQVESGDDTETEFILAAQAASIDHTLVYISGVYQQKDTYTLAVDGLSIEFSEPPPLGTNNIQIIVIEAVSVGTPADGTVTKAKLAPANVVYSSLQSGAIASPGTQQYIPNLDATITTTGRPILLSLVPVDNGLSGPSYISIEATSATTSTSLELVIDYNSGSNAAAFFSKELAGPSATRRAKYSPSEFQTVVTGLAAGTYTFRIKTQLTGGNNLSIVETKLMAMEL